MKKTVRQNVFETNSSACHSITIRAGGEISRKLKQTIFRGGEYGESYQEYTAAEDKLNYALTYVQSYDKHLKWIIEMVKDFTGQSIKVDLDDEAWYFGQMA